MTRAEEWRAKAAVKLMLPSGMEVRARRPGPLQLAEWGRLPMQLAAAASGESGNAPGDLGEMAEHIRRIVGWCLVEPRVPEEIQAEEIPGEDLGFLWRWALRVEEGARLEGFRGERGDGDAGGDSGEVRAAAVGAGGDLGPGDGVEF